MGDRSRLRTLLNHPGIEINAKNEETGQTALHLASIAGQSGVVQTLINTRLDIEAEDNRGQTALHCAAASGHAAVLRLLLMKGAQQGCHR